MLLESYKTFDRCDIVYGFDHLGTLKVKNHDLHEFLMTWNHIIDNLGKFSMNDVHLRDVFYRKIKDEPEMAWDIKRYERMTEYDANKTYEYLRNCVAEVITMQEQKKNLADREALLAAKDQRRDLKVAAAASTKVNASDAKGQAKQSNAQNKTL